MGAELVRYADNGLDGGRGAHPFGRRMDFILEIFLDIVEQHMDAALVSLGEGRSE